MPVGYGYKAPDDLGIVDWAEVTKGFVDMLDTEKKRRVELKAQYAEQDRNLTKDLMNSPMGQFTDGNKFTSDFVSAMTNQRLIDYRLFKQGILNERDYILKTNNAIDGTKSLFDLSKLYQDKFGEYMKGVQEGTLTQQQVFNMMQVEGFKDFSKSKAVLDPTTGAVTLMRLKKNDQTGVMETTGDNMPIGTAMRLMGTELKTFDVEGAMKGKVASYGKLADAIYKAPGKEVAGSITLLEGPEAFKDYPEAKKIVENFYKSVDNTIAGWIDNKYNLSSVLTQNTGLGYDAESMTMSRDEAEKDPTKVLMKIDPSTGITIMDENGPNFEKQKKEAADWIRTNMLAQIDRERKIQSVGAIGVNQKDVMAYGQQIQRNDAESLARNWATILTGTDNESTNAARAIEDAADAQGVPMTISKSGNNLVINGQTYPLTNAKNMSATGGTVLGTLASKLGIGQSALDSKIKQYLPSSATLNTTSNVTAISTPTTVNLTSSAYEGAINSLASQGGDAFVEDNVTSTLEKLENLYGNLGFTFDSQVGKVENYWTDKVKIIAPDGKISDWIQIDDPGVTERNKLKNFINSSLKAIDMNKLDKKFPAIKKSFEEEQKKSTGGSSLNATKRKGG